MIDGLSRRAVPGTPGSKMRNSVQKPSTEGPSGSIPPPPRTAHWGCLHTDTGCCETGKGAAASQGRPACRSSLAICAAVPSWNHCASAPAVGAKTRVNSQAATPQRSDREDIPFLASQEGRAQCAQTPRAPRAGTAGHALKVQPRTW